MREFALTAERASSGLSEPGARSSCESPEPLGAFFVSGKKTGYLLPEVAEYLRSDNAFSAFLEHRPEGIFLIAGDSFQERTHALQKLVSLFLEKGLISSLKNESVDLYAEDMRAASLDRAAVRLLGIGTRVVRLCARDERGRTLLQKRSLHKAVSPGLLDNFAAGMVASGETPLEAIEREIFEETGIRAQKLPIKRRADLDFRTFRVIPEGILNEETIVYETRLPISLTPENQDGEVDAFISLSDYELDLAIQKKKIMPEAALLSKRILE